MTDLFGETIADGDTREEQSEPATGPSETRSDEPYVGLALK